MEDSRPAAVHPIILDEITSGRMRAEVAAEFLRCLGYRRISGKHRLLARIDRPEWQALLQAHLRRCSFDTGDEDWYRRVLSKDQIEVPREVYRLSVASNADRTGWIDPNPKRVRA
jgi:hypothetical protein